MKSPRDLPTDTLVSIVTAVQRALWLDDDDDWNPDKQWSPDTLDEIASALTDAGLNPEDAP